jgi:hypothetical protein
MEMLQGNNSYLYPKQAKMSSLSFFFPFFFYKIGEGGGTSPAMGPERRGWHQ